MRKITQESIAAFNSHFTFKKGNTAVSTGFGTHSLTGDIRGRVTVLSLHGNHIAINIANRLFITNAGWTSNTTKERLNGLPGVQIHQKNFEWFLNGKPWDGSIIEIK